VVLLGCDTPERTAETEQAEISETGDRNDTEHYRTGVLTHHGGACAQKRFHCAEHNAALGHDRGKKGRFRTAGEKLLRGYEEQTLQADT
jgi:hypothetical protein